MLYSYDSQYGYSKWLNSMTRVAPEILAESEKGARLIRDKPLTAAILN
jgi:hypothetical protein